MFRVHVPCNRKQPRALTSPRWWSGAKRSDCLNERVSGEIGNDLGIAAAPGKERSHASHVCAIQHLEFTQAASWVSTRGQRWYLAREGAHDR